MSANLSGLHPVFREWVDGVIAELKKQGFKPTIVSGYRSTAQQTKLYNDYLAGKQKLPTARPGRSAHEFGLAIDVWDEGGRQDAMMRLIKSWGGELVVGDPPHVQYPGYTTWRNSW